jgi:malate dehydrogenase (oxaloacetate-decarboxylating)(NADP+)
MAAAYKLAHLVSETDLEQGSLYPALSRTREVSAHIGAAVADAAHEGRLTDKKRPVDVFADMESQMYEPAYPSYI